MHEIVETPLIKVRTLNARLAAQIPEIRRDKLAKDTAILGQTMKHSGELGDRYLILRQGNGHIARIELSEYRQHLLLAGQNAAEVDRFIRDIPQVFMA